MRLRILLFALLSLTLTAKAQGPAGFTKLNSTLNVVGSYVDLAVTTGSQYAYTVTAVNAAGEGVYGNIIYATVPTTTPTGPGPCGGTVAVHCVAFSWTPASSGFPATGFNIYRQTAAPPFPPNVSPAQVN